LFDITSGVLRNAWDFNEAKLPTHEVISALLPYIGMDKLNWVAPKLDFLQSGMALDFGGIGKEYELGALLDCSDCSNWLLLIVPAPAVSILSNRLAIFC
jgi:thiamine biosynthesis lipoprotein ApbE